MLKNSHKSWTHVKNGPQCVAQHSWLSIHPSYTPKPSKKPILPDDHPTMPNWFKGMAIILEEWGLYPAAGLNVKCKGFKCVTGAMSCCCCYTVFSQLDFASHKLALEELVTPCGNICDFYLKYHCETKFIEMYWGAAKLQYCLSLKTTNRDEWGKNSSGVLGVMMFCNNDVAFADKLQLVPSHSTHCCHFRMTSKIPRTSIPHSNSNAITSQPCSLLV